MGRDTARGKDLAKLEYRVSRSIDCVERVEELYTRLALVIPAYINRYRQ